MLFPRSFLLLGISVALGMEVVFQATELFAQTLPLADNLTSLVSPEGQVLLQHSEPRPITRH